MITANIRANFVIFVMLFLLPVGLLQQSPQSFSFFLFFPLNYQNYKDKVVNATITLVKR